MTPWPSQTPKRYRLFIIKFSIMMLTSWLIFYFLSAVIPLRLQNAYFETRFVLELLLFLECLASSYPHSKGDIFRFYCDFALVCFIFGSDCLFFDYLSFWSFWCCPRQLIVFLCSFFFLTVWLVVEALPKIFKFLISILIFIFGDLGKEERD